MELSERLRSFRKAKKLTQFELAELADIPVRTLKGYESGERQPGAAALAGLARAGCDINWLLTGEPSAASQVCTPSGVEGTGDDSAGFDSAQPPLSGRLLGVLKMVESIEDKEDRELLTDEFFSRIQNAKQMVELKKTVALLSEQKAS